jgi:hypothetical protein
MTLARAKTLQTEPLFNFHWLYHAEPKVTIHVQVGLQHNAIPEALCHSMTGTSEPHHSYQLRLQFHSEHTSSWPVSSSGQIFLLFDGHPHQKTLFSFTLPGTSWKPSRANSYLLLAEKANNLAMWCHRKISWTADSGTSVALQHHSLTGTADHSPLAQDEHITMLQPKPQFLPEEIPHLAHSFTLHSSSSSW